MRVRPVLEGAPVQVALELALPAGPAHALQHAEGEVGQFQIGVAVNSDQGSESQHLGRHDDKLTAVSVE